MASKSGGIIKITNKLAIFENNTNIFINNTALYGNEFGAYPVRMILYSYISSNLVEGKTFCNKTYDEKIENNQLYYNSQECNETFSLKNETPGGIIQTLLKFKLVDYKNQTVVTQSGGLCIIQAKSTNDFQIIETKNLSLVGYTTITLINGVE